MIPFSDLFTEVTLTEQLALLVASPFAVAVIVALPAATAVTCPFSSTVAMLVFEEDHVTVRSCAVSGSTFAVRDVVFPL